MKSLAVVVAHPDDEVLGCGGLIAEAVSQGAVVSLVVVCDGVTSRAGNGSNTERIEARERECCRAASALGVRGDVRFLRFPDQMLGQHSVARVADEISKWLQEPRYDVVATHWTGDLNSDHRIVAQATLVAFRPFSNSRAVSLVGCEVAESTHLGPNAFWPNLFVPLSEASVAKKLAAMGCYRSEHRLPPHPRSFEAISSLACMRGPMIGAEYAEAYHIYRMTA